MENFDLLAYGRSGSPGVFDKRVSNREVGIDQHGNARGARQQLVQEPTLLRRQGRNKKGHARDVAARPVAAADQAEFDGVTAAYEDDRDGRSRRLGRNCRGGIVCSDYCHPTAYQIGCEVRQLIVLVLAPAILDRHIPALDVAHFTNALLECGQKVCTAGTRRAVEHPDHRHRRLLRARRDRPRGRRAAEQRDELAPLHSITSSARCWSSSGTSSPRAFAVFRLMTSSNSTGNWTGRLLGFSPLRILST